MATVLQDEETDQKDQSQPAGQDSGQQLPGAGGAASGGAAPSMPGGMPSAYQPKQKGSGRFTNIRKYIQANQPEQVAQNLSQRVTGTGERQAQAVRQGIQQSQKQFGEQEREISQQATAGREAAQAAFQDPTQLSEAQRQQFGQLYGGQVASQAAGIRPDLSQAQAEAQELQQMQAMAQDPRQRFKLLQQTIGRPGETYTSGQSALDESFLLGTGAGKQIQQRFGELTGEIGQEIETTGTEFESRQQALQDLAEQKRTEAEEMLLRGASPEEVEAELGQMGFEDIEASLQQQLQETIESRPEELAALRERIDSGQLNNEDLQKLGLTSGQRLFNIDPSAYLRQELEQPTLAGIANQEQFERYQALRGLLGKEADVFSGATEEQIGQFDPSMARPEELQDAIQQREDEAIARLQESIAPAWQQWSGWMDRIGDLGDPNKVSSRYDNLKPIYQAIRASQDLAKTKGGVGNLESVEQMRDIMDLIRQSSTTRTKDGAIQSTGVLAKAPQAALRQLDQQLRDFYASYDPERRAQAKGKI